jgi:hypothetical protein
MRGYNEKLYDNRVFLFQTMEPGGSKQEEMSFLVSIYKMTYRISQSGS